MTKVAILLCSHIRSWEKCRESFLKFTKDLDCDIFVHTYNTCKDYHTYVQNKYGITENKLTKHTENINLNIPHKKLVIEDDVAHLQEIKEIEDKDSSSPLNPKFEQYHELQMLKGKGISIRTYLSFRKFRMCNELRKEYEKETGIKYDYVVKARMDLDYNYCDPLFVLLEKVKIGTILTSSGNTQPNDHIYIGFPEDVDKLLLAMKTLKFKEDKEHSAHEYLFGLFKVSCLTFNPSINNLPVARLLDDNSIAIQFY
jgi:hypothetical protein